MDRSLDSKAEWLTHPVTFPCHADNIYRDHKLKMTVICLPCVVYFLKPFLFPCKVSNPAIFSHTLESIPWLQHWSISCSPNPLHCLGCCLNLGTRFIPQWENLEPKGNGLFPKIGTDILKKRKCPKMGNMEFTGAKKKWANAVLNVCHCREVVKQCI